MRRVRILAKRQPGLYSCTAVHVTLSVCLALHSRPSESRLVAPLAPPAIQTGKPVRTSANHLPLSPSFLARHARIALYTHTHAHTHTHTHTHTPGSNSRNGRKLRNGQADFSKRPGPWAAGGRWPTRSARAMPTSSQASLGGDKAMDEALTNELTFRTLQAAWRRAPSQLNSSNLNSSVPP